MEKIKRFLVIGEGAEVIYAEIVYATNETKAKEKFIKISKQLNRVENFDNIKVKEKPFK